MDMSVEEGQIGTWDNQKIKAPTTDDSWGNQNTTNNDKW